MTTDDAPPTTWVDTETTSLVHPWLPHGRRPWEITLHRDDTDHGPLTLVVIDVDLTHADPQSLAMNHYWDRCAREWAMIGDGAMPRVLDGGARLAVTEEETAGRVADYTRGTVLAGCNPAFDAETLAAMLHRHGWPAEWHYTVYDAKSAAIAATGLHKTASTSTIARALDIEVRQYATHTSAGDVALARAIDAATRRWINPPQVG